MAKGQNENIFQDCELSYAVELPPTFCHRGGPVDLMFSSL